jgi:hypothetical protein
MSFPLTLWSKIEKMQANPLTPRGQSRIKARKARVAELVDARDLKSLGACHCAGSSPAPGINKFRGLANF